MTAGRRLVHRLAATAATAALLVTVLPALAPLEVHAADSGAYGDRLIVLWKDAAPDGVTTEGVRSMRTTLSPRRTIVVATHGAAAMTAARLRRDPRVKAVIPDIRVEATGWPDDAAPNDPYYAGYQADLPLVRVPQAWQTTLGAGVTVAVLDTGITASHPDFACLSIVSPYNATNGSTNPADGHGHGTHVTGTVAACANNGQGVAGIAPAARIMPIKVLADNGSGAFSWIMDGIDWARTHGAGVISMSLGGIITDPTTIAYYQGPVTAAWNAGVTIVAAAGNTGTNAISYPASFDHVISVAATDNAGARASFSTFNQYVDIAAPGVNTASTYLSGGYTQLSGTSMATPHVSGIAALVRSAHPDWTPDQVEAVLEATAVDKGAAGRDDSYGYGLIDAAAAVGYTIDPANPPVVRPNPTPRPSPTSAPTPTPAPTPAQPPRVTSLRASVATISYDPNHYCDTAAKSSVITAMTGLASSTVGASTAVTLTYLRPDGSSTSVAMTRGSATLTSQGWTTPISTLTDTALRAAGTIAYYVTAQTASGISARYPLGGNAALRLAVCPNIPPTVGAPTVPWTTVWTNPLGSGTVPPTGFTSVPLSARVSDSDGVASVSAVLSGAGLAAPVTVPMALDGSGAWSATITPTELGVPGGALAWRVVATDTKGAVSAGRAGPAITVARADTRAVISDTALVLAAGNVPTVTFSVVDPDATLGATTTTGSASVSWSATYIGADGLSRSIAPTAVRASYTGAGTFRAVLSGTWLNTALRSVRITVVPSFKDPWAAAVPGTGVVTAVVPTGAPVVVSAAASTTAAYTDPLGTGNKAALLSLPDTVTFTTNVADTDGLGTVFVVLSGAGLPAPTKIQMASSSGRWTTSVRLSEVGVTGSGALSWKISATDQSGLTGTGRTGTITVTRANTPGTAAITDVALDPAGTGNVLVTMTVDDPDGTFGSTSSMAVSVRWSGVVGSTTYSIRSTAAAYLGGHTFRARLAVGASLPVGRTATLTLAPVAVDPYKGTTSGAAVTRTLAR